MKKVVMIIMMWLISGWSAIAVPDNLEADFNQTVTGKSSKKALHYRGHMAIKGASYAKWQYTDPIPKTVCLDNDRAWIIEPDLEQATLYHLDQTIPILHILQKAKQTAPQQYSAEYNHTLYLIRTDHRQLPVQIEYNDDLGNHVTIRLTQIRTDPLKKEALKCVIPDDYDIIDGRY